MTKIAPGPSLLEMMESHFDEMRRRLLSDYDPFLEGKISGLADAIGIVRHPYGFLGRRPGWDDDLAGVYAASDQRIAGRPGVAWNGVKD